MSPLTVIVFSSPNRAVEEVFQETPDEGGMEPFAKIRSGDAGAQALRSHPPRKRSCVGTRSGIAGREWILSSLARTAYRTYLYLPGCHV